ncbi:MAG: hypothetical protein JXR03_03310 [Cyclobacteriaceae bacterium]
MKSLTKITLASLMMMFITVQTFAGDDPNSKLVEKAKKAVEEAESNDWETLAQSAEICFIKKENLEQAVQWINKSIEIKETTYNLEVQGDYLSSIGKRKEAKSAYYKAILIAKESEFDANTGRLQKKLWKLR